MLCTDAGCNHTQILFHARLCWLSRLCLAGLARRAGGVHSSVHVIIATNRGHKRLGTFCSVVFEQLHRILRAMDRAARTAARFMSGALRHCHTDGAQLLADLPLLHLVQPGSQRAGAAAAGGTRAPDSPLLPRCCAPPTSARES